MTHLTSDELVDAVENTLGLERRAHITQCDHCREQIAQLTSLLADVRDVDLPEPSPLFWDRFSDNVRRVVAADAAAPPRVVRWFEWPVLVPLGALAVLLLALVSSVPQSSHDIRRSQLAMNSGDDIGVDPAADADEHWELIAALIGEVDADTADDAGLMASPGAADDVVLQLTSGERQELIRLVREELLRERVVNPLRDELKGSGG